MKANLLDSVLCDLTLQAVPPFCQVSVDAPTVVRERSDTATRAMNVTKGARLHCQLRFRGAFFAQILPKVSHKVFENFLY